MPECLQPTVTVPGVPGQFEAEKSKMIFHIHIFILPIMIIIFMIIMMIMIIIIIMITIIIMFTFLGFPVVGKLQDQVGVTGCPIDSAPSASS